MCKNILESDAFQYAKHKQSASIKNWVAYFTRSEHNELDMFLKCHPQNTTVTNNAVSKALGK